MTKNKEENNDEANNDVTIERPDKVATSPKENPIMKKISEEIQKILEDSGLALQPALAISPYGIMPKVQLVEIPKGVGEDKEEVKEEVKTDEK